jgi:hypothetical protein
VINHEAFDAEFDALPHAVRVELLAATGGNSVEIR